MKLTRKRGILMVTPILLGAGVIGSLLIHRKIALREITPLRICVASDVHYLASDLTDQGQYFTNMINNSDGKAMFYIEEITDAFLLEVKRQKPDYLIISGDLTFNGERLSHQKLAEKLEDLEETGTRVLVLPGNHDIENRMAARFEGDHFFLTDSVSGADFAGIYQELGYEEALSRDEYSLSYTAELEPGLWALFIDTNTVEAPGKVREETLHWAEKQLKQARQQGVRVLGVSHQNLRVHNPIFQGGYVIEGHEKLAALYEKYDVLVNLSGHMHIQHVAQATSGPSEILTSALPVSPCQYGILEIGREEMNYYTDEVTFPHRREARDLMWHSSRRTVENDVENISEEAADFFAEVNMAYFAGRSDRIEWNEDAFQEIFAGGSLPGSYLKTVQAGGFHNDTIWQMSLPDQ